MNDEHKPLRLVVTGSRDYHIPSNDFDRIMQRALLEMDLRRQEFHIDHVGHTLSVAQGGAKGVDQMVRNWVLRQGQGRVESVTFHADWDNEGRKAGPLRNQRMLREHKPELVLAFWTGETNRSGTFHCLKTAVDMGIPVLIEPTKRRTTNV